MIPTGYGRKTLKSSSSLTMLLPSLVHDATVRVAMEFLLIFGETNFVEVLKIHKIHKIYGPRNKSALRYLSGCKGVYE